MGERGSEIEKYSRDVPDVLGLYHEWCLAFRSPAMMVSARVLSIVYIRSGAFVDGYDPNFGVGSFDV